MAIVDPVVLIRWQAASPFGIVSGEVETRIRHGYRKEVVTKVKEEMRTKNRNRISSQWCISLVDETGQTIYRRDHKI